MSKKDSKYRSALRSFSSSTKRVVQEFGRKGENLLDHAATIDDAIGLTEIAR